MFDGDGLAADEEMEMKRVYDLISSTDECLNDAMREIQVESFEPFSIEFGDVTLFRVQKLASTSSPLSRQLGAEGLARS